jgi:DNA-binding transcriptional MerR regulator
MPAELPDKLYYSISEVAEHTQVKPHVLRYWESEFPTLRPRKNRAGNRSYRRKDIDEVLSIKRLLYAEGYKIDGARKVLRDAAARLETAGVKTPAGARASASAPAGAVATGAAGPRPSDTARRRLAELRRELAELLEMVRRL